MQNGHPTARKVVEGVEGKISFKVHGPFPIPKDGKVLIDDLKYFWNQGSELQHLASKKGCYVFAIQAGRRCRPYYVGKTHSHEVNRR